MSLRADLRRVVFCNCLVAILQACHLWAYRRGCSVLPCLFWVAPTTTSILSFARIATRRVRSSLNQFGSSTRSFIWHLTKHSMRPVCVGKQRSTHGNPATLTFSHFNAIDAKGMCFICTASPITLSDLSSDGLGKMIIFCFVMRSNLQIVVCHSLTSEKKNNCCSDEIEQPHSLAPNHTIFAANYEEKQIKDIKLQVSSTCTR